MPVVTLNRVNTKIKDGMISKPNPTSYYATTTGLTVGVASSANDIYRALVHFDLGLIPNNATINSASLQLRQNTTGATSARTLNVHPLTSEFQEDTNLIWNNFYNSFDSSSAYSYTASNINSDIHTGDITNLVREWVNGTRPNYGIMLKESDETALNTNRTYWSKDNASGVDYPALIIDYTIPTTGKKQVEYVGNGGVSQQATNSTSFSIGLPAGQTDDFLIAQLVYFNTTAVTLPSGWSVSADNLVGNTSRHIIAYKRRAASEVTPTFTSTQAAGWSGVIHALRNVKSYVFGGFAPFTTGTTAYPAGSVSTTVDNTAFMLLNINTMNNPFTPPLGYNEVADFSANGQHQASIRYMYTDRDQTSTEMTSTTAAMSGSSSLFVLQPIVNNVPTDPSGVTVDKSSYTVGDTITISFTGSTDPDGDALTYEADIYDGVSAWTNIATGKAGSPITATVPAMVDTSGARIRVRAKDTKGDYSNYAQSATFTVQQKDGQITAPVNVVSTAYLVSQMARPVMLSNKWLVGAVRNGTTAAYFYVSKDNGRTWAQLCYTAHQVYTPIALVSKGTKIYATAARNTSTIDFYVIEATTVSNTAITTSLNTELNTDYNGVTNGITPDGTKLWWGASTKNATYPNSYNIRAGSIPINGDGTLGTPSAVTQVTKNNATGSGYDSINPALVIGSDGIPVIIAQGDSGTNKFIFALSTKIPNDNNNGYGSSRLDSGWGMRNIYADNYVQTSPTGCRTPNGKLHTAWHGTDSTDTTNAYIRYSNSTDGATWITAKKLVKGQNATFTSDKNGKLIITYEDAGSIKRIESTDEFATWTAPVTIGAGTKPVSLFDQSFTLDFTVPPTIYQATGVVKYFGSYNVNTAPTLTLTSPANNLVLSEGNSYSIQGSASDVDSGNVVTVKYKINNGPTKALQSGVSDGSTPISFAKTLQYHDKRLWDGATDVTGTDLAENTPHILSVWVEDDKGGVSATVTRTFQVIWNRPPTISGSDTNLGSISAIPTVNYTVTEPESDTFTVTEYLDGVQTKSFAGVAGQNYSATIDPNTWLTLALDVPHEIRIRATDSKGLYSERVYTFVRTETQIKFELNLDDPATKAFFTDATMPSRILVTLDAVIPAGASITKVEVTNNAFDASPVWEDATGPAKAGRGYLFTNKTKTAANWGINIRVTIDKGTATDRVILNGFGGAFD